MSGFDVIERVGVVALLGFLALLLAFVALYTVRLLVLAVLGLLTALLRGLDWFLTRRLAGSAVPA